MLWVRGEVALTCITVTRPIAKPMKPVMVMLSQKNDENSLSLASEIICWRRYSMCDEEKLRGWEDIRN